MFGLPESKGRLFSLFDGALQRLSGEVGSLPGSKAGAVAVATLLIHIARVDGNIVRREYDYLVTLLEQRFGLSAAQARNVLAYADEQEKEALNIAAYVRPLRRELNREERKKLILAAWDVARCDGTVHDFEEDVIWRSARLLDLDEAEIDDLRAQAMVKSLHPGPDRSDCD